MECWQSGNAPDSKSGEPSFPWRAGSNPVHSLLFMNFDEAANLYLATRNLGYVYTLMSDEINCYDLVNADYVVVEEAAVKMIEEALK